ncbi:aspartate dehydrogenase [Acuticoccus sp. I52.16.1]|uniref:aspartate dehydrogenase n=1 Tax=Acuticoccus sp. I52.16.1 TaxID=2928472 RepID=UPI001FD4D816|nr:aspartate dehydrogenase [Acuticoccus sp. I52.16.1]UOM34423.1 aspartate dehydrogenase [Acuticoccus sp. I52.16.1]
MRVAIIGRGPIARFVAGHLAPPLTLAQLLLRPGAEAPHDVPVVTDAADVDADLVADCAGLEGLRAHGPALLEAGHRVFTLSAAAFADPALGDALRAAAERGGGRIILAAGAIGAIDTLAAAKVGGLSAVRYTGRKPPAGWAGTPAEAHDLANLTGPLVHFEGTAREAALAYPKNANVAATAALAGIGFEGTTVRLIADPGVEANTHTLEAEGAFGRFTATFEAAPLPGNPRSSALAAMSLVRALGAHVAALSIV